MAATFSRTTTTNQLQLSVLNETPVASLNHDEQYVRRLQQTFGTSTIPQFGGIVCVMVIVLVVIVVTVLNVLAAIVRDGGEGLLRSTGSGNSIEQELVQRPYTTPIITLD